MEIESSVKICDDTIEGLNDLRRIAMKQCHLDEVKAISYAIVIAERYKQAILGEGEHMLVKKELLDRSIRELKRLYLIESRYLVSKGIICEIENCEYPFTSA